MIVSRTPFRVTLGGGGTDLPSYYEEARRLCSRHGHRQVHVRVDQCAGDRPQDPGQVHEERGGRSPRPIAARAGARGAQTARHLFAHGDRVGRRPCAQARGSVRRVATSSAFSRPLRSYKRELCPLQDLAEEACDIEINTLGKGIGKQDQYMAVFGGVTVLDIAQDGTVDVRRANINATSLSDFQANTQLYWTGVRRSAPEMLRDQDNAMKSEESPAHEVVQGSLHSIKEIGYGIVEAIESRELRRVRRADGQALGPEAPDVAEDHAARDRRPLHGDQGALRGTRRQGVGRRRAVDSSWSTRRPSTRKLNALHGEGRPRTHAIPHRVRGGRRSSATARVRRECWTTRPWCDRCLPRTTRSS